MPSASVSTQRPTPSSLTQRGAQPAGSCPSCGSTRFTALAMTLTDGTTADFLSCHACEHRAWSAQGTRMEFTEVLKRTRKIKPTAG